MSNTAYIPAIIPITVTPAGVTLDFTAIGRMAAISLSNMDPAVIIYGSFDGMPPSAALQNGVFALDPTINPILNLENIAFGTIGLKVAAGSAVLQALALQRPGGGTSGGGFGG